MNLAHSHSSEQSDGIPAMRFDGISAAGEPVRLFRQTRGWRIERQNLESCLWSDDDVVFADDTDLAQANFRTPDGAIVVLETPVRREELPRAHNRTSAWIESRRNAWLSALATVLIPIVLLTIAIPAMVNVAAPMIPVTWEKKLGEAVYESFSRTHSMKSRLPDDTKARIEQRFDEIKQTAGLEWVELRFYGGAPNAMALPGGIVMISDELINLVSSDDRVVAVLAHELGHIKDRHNLRGLASYTLASQVITVAMGQDQLTTKVADLIARNAIFARYSQPLEKDADRYACEILVKHQLAPELLGDVFERFENYYKQHVNVDSGSYTSTHPPTGDRIAAARACAKEFGFER